MELRQAYDDACQNQPLPRWMTPPRECHLVRLPVAVLLHLANAFLLDPDANAVAPADKARFRQIRVQFSSTERVRASGTEAIQGQLYGDTTQRASKRNATQNQQLRI